MLLNFPHIEDNNSLQVENQHTQQGQYSARIEPLMGQYYAYRECCFYLILYQFQIDFSQLPSEEAQFLLPL